MEKSSIANYLSSLYRWCKYRKLCITIDTSYVPKRAKTYNYFVMLYSINWRIFVAAIPKLQIISKVVLHIKSSKPWWYSCRFSTTMSLTNKVDFHFPFHFHIIHVGILDGFSKNLNKVNHALGWTVEIVDAKWMLQSHKYITSNA